MFRRLFLFIVTVSCLACSPVLACDACGCTLSRTASESLGARKPFFFDFNFEVQNWKKLEPRAAHTLHHQGHHVHDKTHEEFYHFTFGANPSEDWTILAELPYIVRHSLEIDDHARLGQKETSEGLGDLNLTATYRIWKQGDSFLGPVAGIKVPIGETGVKNSTGDRFEAELQPGTGSVDYSFGAAFRFEPAERLAFRGNALYRIKTEGDQDFEYGDLFSSYLILDYLLNPEASSFESRLGVDMNLQIEDKQTDAGTKMADSGGTMVLLGPALTVKINENTSFLGNFLLPVHQNLGGVHQKVDFVANAGFRLDW